MVTAEACLLEALPQRAHTGLYGSVQGAQLHSSYCCCHHN